jgi:hypothetical protein
VRDWMVRGLVVTFFGYCGYWVAWGIWRVYF